MLWTIGAAALAVFAADVFGWSLGGGAALLALTGFLWVALLLAIAYSFPQGPPPLEPGDGFWRRIQKRLIWFLFALLAVFTVAVGGLVALLTVRAIGLMSGTP